MPDPETLLAQLTRLMLGSPDELGRERLAQEAIAATGDPNLAQQLLGQGLSRERFISSQAARGVSSGALGVRERGLFDVMQGLETAPRTQQLTSRGYSPNLPPEPEPAPLAPVAPIPAPRISGSKHQPKPPPGPLESDPRILALRQALAEQRRIAAADQSARLSSGTGIPGQIANPTLGHVHGGGLSSIPGALGSSFGGTGAIETPEQGFARVLSGTRPGDLEALDNKALSERILAANFRGDRETKERGFKIMEKRLSFAKEFGASAAVDAARYHRDNARRLKNAIGGEDENVSAYAGGLTTREQEEALASGDVRAYVRQKLMEAAAERQAVLVQRRLREIELAEREQALAQGGR